MWKCVKFTPNLRSSSSLSSSQWVTVPWFGTVQTGIGLKQARCRYLQIPISGITQQKRELWTGRTAIHPLVTSHCRHPEEKFVVFWIGNWISLHQSKSIIIPQIIIIIRPSKWFNVQNWNCKSSSSIHYVLFFGRTITHPPALSLTNSTAAAAAAVLGLRQPRRCYKLRLTSSTVCVFGGSSYSSDHLQLICCMHSTTSGRESRRRSKGISISFLWWS